MSDITKRKMKSIKDFLNEYSGMIEEHSKQLNESSELVPGRTFMFPKFMDSEFIPHSTQIFDETTGEFQIVLEFR